MKVESRTAHILLAEDNEADARLVRYGLAETGRKLDVHVVLDGEQALCFLRQEGAYRTAPPPDLVLLDLNMPRKTGLEVLSELRATTRLRHTPVVVLTSSRAPADIEAAYEHGANAFMQKPSNLDDMLDQMKAVEQYWLQHVVLPAPPSPAP